MKRTWSARLAQEAEERCCYRSRLIKTPDRISDRPPREAVFLFCTVNQVREATE
jgi:hypothetical protein